MHKKLIMAMILKYKKIFISVSLAGLFIFMNLMVCSFAQAAEPGLVTEVCAGELKESSKYPDFKDILVKPSDSKTIDVSYLYKGIKRTRKYSNPAYINTAEDIKKSFIFANGDNVFGPSSKWVLLFKDGTVNNLYAVIDSNGFFDIFTKQGDSYYLVNETTIKKFSLSATDESYLFGSWINSELFIHCKTLEEQEAAEAQVAKVKEAEEALKTAESNNALANASAPTYSSIRSALSPGNPQTAWVIDSWKIVLGIANLALVLALAALAAINILHIQYDTYAIKKVLPLLIMGVILADFSLLIIRMLLDLSNITTLLFTNGQTPADFAKALISGASQTINDTSGLTGLGILFIWFLFSLLVMIAFLILGFLFYIRYIVIIVCAISAPLAFIALAFPPTQGFFKQWWGWLAKYIFMKPIVFFFLWIAFQIRTRTNMMDSMTGWAIVAALVLIAVVIPFKLGGTVMDAWGKAGKWLTGTKAGGYIRKPIDSFIQSKKDAWKERANLGAEKYLGMAARRQRHALTMERLKNERTRMADQSQVKLRGQLGQRLGEEKAKQARAKKDVEDIDLINDILDREKRGETRTKNELRDRTIAATHNAVTKSWMHKMFEGEEEKAKKVGEDYEREWQGVMAPHGEKTWSMTLGEIEGASGEVEGAIEKINSDAMLRIATRKLDVYYTKIAKAVITEGGEEREFGQTFDGVLENINELQKQQQNYNIHSEDYKELSVKISTERKRGKEILSQIKTRTEKDEKGEEKPLLTPKEFEDFEMALRGMRRAENEQGPATES